MNSIHQLPFSRSPNGQSLKQRQVGLTLLEMMIALSLGLLLLVGIGTIFVGSQQTYRVQEENARIQESGRFALDLLGRSIRQAGYWNMSVNPVDPNNGFSGTPITGTATTITLQYDGTGASDCSGAVINAGNIVQEALDLNANNLRCSATNVAPLISNVEDLEFLYGIDTNGDQSADQYVAAPTAAQLPLVVSVRTCVLIRSGSGLQGLGITTTAQKYLNCAGALGTATGAAALTTAGDTRLRRTFVATFNLRNRVNTQP
jgi:type IV pilus assembly protein PilW